MRKLVVSMNVSLDGFISGPDGELTWQFPYWNHQMSAYAIRLLAESDTIVMGKRTYRSMAPYWPMAPDDTFAQMMNTYSKLIFSRSLKSVKWRNSRLATKDIKNEISSLKTQSGKNIIIYGSGSIVRSCIRLGLVDEYYIWLHPVIIGKGNLMFKGVKGRSYLGLEQIEVFDSGVVVLKYLSNPIRSGDLVIPKLIQSSELLASY